MDLGDVATDEHDFKPNRFQMAHMLDTSNHRYMYVHIYFKQNNEIFYLQTKENLFTFQG